MKQPIIILTAVFLSPSLLKVLPFEKDLRSSSSLSAQVIVGGVDHSLAKCSDGTLRSWGDDFYGQLGDNAALVDMPTPVQAAALTGIIAIAAGAYHSIALKSDGTVWSWGNDVLGQLGNDAALVDKPTPVQVTGLTGIIAIAAGSYHSLALKSDGTAWAWGYDGFGQLGDDFVYLNQPTPVPVDALTLSGIIAIAGGGSHSLALKNDGTVWAWGSDAQGQLGDNAALINQPIPAQTSSLTGITAITGGTSHSFALKNDSTVWSWGWDASGQLGDDAALANKSTPVQIVALTGIIAISGGGTHSLALKNDGTVWSWGFDFYGQLGDGGTNLNQPTPVQVSVLTAAISIAGGGNHSLALKNDGTVWSWGRDGEGQLGNDTFLAQKPTPVQVTPLCNVTLPGGISEIYQQGAITIYPNPSSGLFQVQSSEFKVQSLKVYNVLGEKVYDAPSLNAANYNSLHGWGQTINLFDKPDGVYFIHAKTEKGITTQKLILKK